MGITYLEVEVGHPADPDKWETVTFLIDTGALFSIVPAPILHRLGIEPRGTQNFRLADGRLMSRQKGIAAFRWGPHFGGADVIFGEPGDATLLGALTLESLGLGVDPLRHDLIEVAAVL